MGGGSRSGRGATERKSWRWQGVVARWHSLGGSAPLPRTTRGPGRVGEASRSQTRCLHRSKGSRPEAMLSRATCVTPSRPCLLPGPRYCHPLALRTRCSSSWPGLCVARRHKAGKRTSDARPREQEHCGGRDAGPQSTQPAPTGPRHKRRRVLSLAAAPLAPRPPRAPSACGSTLPQPLAGPPPPALRPACQAFRGDHSPGRPAVYGGQGWVQRGCTSRRGRGSAASSAGRTSGEQGEGAGEGERRGCRAPLLLTSSRAGSSPRGGAWQGTALLCVAGPVCSAPRRRPPSW